VFGLCLGCSGWEKESGTLCLWGQVVSLQGDGTVPSAGNVETG
jgi:hypothetical protein